jgi:SMI1 / KNR4 family (SUKH-1)
MQTASGATDDMLQRLQAAVPHPLPDDYSAFLRWSDGAEGDIGSNYIQLWSVERVATPADVYQEFVPGLLFIAGDGGAGLFGYDLRQTPSPIVVTHTDDLDLATLVTVAPSFCAFLDFLAKHDWIAFWAQHYRPAQSSR